MPLRVQNRRMLRPRAARSVRADCQRAQRVASVMPRAHRVVWIGDVDELGLFLRAISSSACRSSQSSL